MPDTWNNLVADWATDRGHPLTDVTVRLLGTPLWVEARLRHAAGASDTVCRMLLDHALAHTGMAPREAED